MSRTTRRTVRFDLRKLPQFGAENVKSSLPTTLIGRFELRVAAFPTSPMPIMTMRAGAGTGLGRVLLTPDRVVELHDQSGVLDVAFWRIRTGKTALIRVRNQRVTVWPWWGLVLAARRFWRRIVHPRGE